MAAMAAVHGWPLLSEWVSYISVISVPTQII